MKRGKLKIRGRIETIPITEFKISKNSLNTDDLRRLITQTPPVKSSLKNSQGIIIIIIWDFKIQTDRLVTVDKKKKKIKEKKRTCWIVDFAIPANPRVKIKENKIRDKYLNLAREQKKKHESDSDTSCNWCAWNDPQRLVKGAGRVGDRGTSRDRPNYIIFKISQNTKKSPGIIKNKSATRSPPTKKKKFGVKYGNGKNITGMINGYITWEKNSKNSKKTPRWTYTCIRLEQHSRKYSIGKHQAMIAYIDFSFKNPRLPTAS